jgi:tetratricopeptide (TPR) repeat protein
MVTRWCRVVLFGTLAALLLAGIGARQWRLAEAAGKRAAARGQAARLRALEDRVIDHPADRGALVALAQAYQVTFGPAAAAPLWERAAAAAQLRSGAPTRPGSDQREGSGLTEPRPAALHDEDAPQTALRSGTSAPGPGPSPPPADLALLLRRAQQHPADLGLQRQVVALCQQLNLLSEAAPALKRLAQADPGNPATWRRLGVAEMQAGRDAAACEHLRAAVVRAPRDPVAWFYLGLAYGGRAEVPEALAAFQRVQELRPDYAPAALERIRLEIEDWRLREAVIEARRLIERRPRLADARYQLGVALFHLHDPRAAEAALRDAVRLDPRPARYHAWLGLTLLEQGRLAEATLALEAAVAHNPDYSNGYYQLGRAYLLQGRLDDAERALRRALILDPRLGEAYFSLGQLLLRRGQRDQAALRLARFQALADFEQRRHYLERLAAVEPRRAEWRRRLGDLYAREGLFREARMQQDRAEEIAASDTVARASAPAPRTAFHPWGG